MKLVLRATDLLMRLRYPASLPEEVAQALGLEIGNFLSFKKFLHALTSPDICPKTLFRFMPRQEAEQAFEGALRKELFAYSSLFSFYFPEGWLEFELQFDQELRLRRVFLHHKLISCPSGFELPLTTPHAWHALQSSSTQTLP